MSAPSLTRVEPSTVDTRELPRRVDVIGKRLNRSPTLSLVDDAPAHLTPPTVLLDGQPLKVVAQSSSEKLVVQLPPTLAPGDYDLSVKIGSMEVRLESGLHVASASSQLLDASPATDAGANAGDASGGSSDASAGTFVETGADASEPATTTDVTSDIDAPRTETTSTTPELEAATPAVDANESVAAPNDARADAALWSEGPTTGDAGLGQDAQSNSSSESSAESSSPSIGDAGLSFDAGNSIDASDSGTDASLTADAAQGANDPVFRCAPGEFGSPEVVTVEGYTEERLWSPTLSADGFTLYFTDGSHSSGKLMKATRSDRGNTFVDAEYIPTFFASGATGTPYITPNGLALYFYSIQASGLGSRDMYVATRTSVSDDFANPINLTSLNSTSLDHLPWVSRDELWFVWISQRDGQTNYWTATRPTKTGAFSTPEILTSLTLPGSDGRMFISYDGLLAYFSSGDRAGGKGSEDIWYATRASVTDDFGGLGNVGIVNTMDGETDVTLSHDGEELFFVRTGNVNVLYRATATCN